MRRILGFALVALILWGTSAPILSLDEVTPQRDPNDPNLFQFVRIRYNGYVGFLSSQRWGPPPWMHDYPRAERNLLKILQEITAIQTTEDSYLILDLNDPQIMNYPILYVSEPGYWNITEEEAGNLREYFLRGGFVIFDDFRGQGEWRNLTSAMKKVLPEQSFRQLTVDHPMFHCFYDIDSLNMIPPYNVPGPPQFFGLFDEYNQLVAVANYNNDIGDYWEWADDSLTPINLSNEAFKFGVNYIIYGITH
ncbi:DUF4159 domain-containing protein [Acidobacteria bacterium AH-259-D05]|nr:DUF4159 domain-containing protein [Acidobacteria bacterium AH-259-D05]